MKEASIFVWFWITRHHNRSWLLISSYVCRSKLFKATEDWRTLVPFQDLPDVSWEVEDLADLIEAMVALDLEVSPRDSWVGIVLWWIQAMCIFVSTVAWIALNCECFDTEIFLFTGSSLSLPYKSTRLRLSFAHLTRHISWLCCSNDFVSIQLGPAWRIGNMKRTRWSCVRAVYVCQCVCLYLFCCCSPRPKMARSSVQGGQHTQKAVAHQETSGWEGVASAQNLQVKTKIIQREMCDAALNCQRSCSFTTQDGFLCIDPPV